MTLHPIFINAAVNKILKYTSPEDAKQKITEFLEKAYQDGFRDGKNIKSSREFSHKTSDNWKGAQGTCDFDEIPETGWL